ncbi:MAG: patatin-like phospholipase family protein [Candidatus Omnitrophica bacterium]|nr:patatin-like phospholipase family protein [Candidatus Omnitrophota bacterium]
MKELINKELIFEEIPLFSGLAQQECDFIKERSTFVEYKKGELIYAQDTPASALYCIILGRVVIFTSDKHGNEVVLEYLHRGKYFGVISLLIGDTHSVSARALNDCTLLVIPKDDFHSILKKAPQIAVDLSQMLSRRLKNKDIHRKTIFESTVISVFSSYSQAGKTIYALNLALSLYKETKKPLIILDVCPSDTIHSLPQKLDIASGYRVLDLSGLGNGYVSIADAIIKNIFGIDTAFFTYKPEDESAAKKLVAIFTLLVNDYNYVILDLPSSMDQFVLEVLNQSDAIHVLTSPEPVDLKRTSHLVTRLKSDFHFHQDKIKIIINEYKFSKLTYQEQVDLLGAGIFATLPRIEFSAHDRLVLDETGSEYARAIRRISRQIGDGLVGLALGVGAGYGFCHIGVLKVFEEENIPVDVISGSSMGAIIASLWATGRRADEIMEITREFKEPKQIWGLIDLTLPFLGLIKGNKLYNFLKRYFGNKTFYDVRLPLKIVASNIRKKEPQVIEKGLLVDALMASCSMPGVFRPFRLKEEILFDGGVIHPLPTEPLFNMGVKKIIAVNVTPTREDIFRQREKLEMQFTSSKADAGNKQRPNLRDYFKNMLKANILESVFSSIEFMQSELAQREGELADIVLHPDTTGMHWLELSRAGEFAKRGEEETRRNLEKIWKLVNE